MTCGACYRRRQERPLNVSHAKFEGQVTAQRMRMMSLRGQGAYGLDIPHILGTWDYKWPLGSGIRIAFQRPPESENVTPETFENAVTVVRSTAERWAKALKAKGYEELLKYLPKLQFLPGEANVFEPPLGPDNSITDQHRSAFRIDRRIDYDVLISLQDLPVVRADPFRGFGDELEDLTFPTCDLGSYARRSDYGAPTIYMGRFGKYVTPDIDLPKYLSSNIGQHTIVHIFGHVLGLAHTYQHPTLIAGSREDFYRPVSEVIEFMQKTLGVQLTPRTVHENLLDAWPGDFTFSDWLEFTDEERREHLQGKLDTIMAPPYYAALVRGVNPGAGEDLLDEARTEPSDKDLDTLRLMYEPSVLGKPDTLHLRPAAR